MSGIMEFGCFVELQGTRRRVEGLVHINNLASQRVASVKEVVSRGLSVWVKVCVTIYTTFYQDHFKSEGDGAVPKNLIRTLQFAVPVLAYMGRPGDWMPPLFCYTTGC